MNLVLLEQLRLSLLMILYFLTPKIKLSNLPKFNLSYIFCLVYRKHVCCVAYNKNSYKNVHFFTYKTDANENSRNVISFAVTFFP